MNVGENTSSSDPVFDILSEQYGAGAEESQQQESQDTQPEIKESSSDETSTTEETLAETTETPTSEDTSSETTEENPANGGFDQNTFLSETFGGMFNSVEELHEADAVNKLRDFDQLYEELLQYRDAPDPEPQYANNFVKELNDYMRNGGDAKTFFETISVNYDEVSDVDIMKREFMHKHGLTAEEATTLINDRYRLDEDEYTESEMKVGMLNMKMDANKLRDEFKAIQDKARIPDNVREVEDFESAEDARMNEWDRDIESTVQRFTNPTFKLGDADDNLGEWSYELSSELRTDVDEAIYNIIEGVGLDRADAQDPEFLNSMVEKHLFGSIGKKVAQAMASEAVSRYREKVLKERHNPNPIPGTETATGGGESLSRDEAIYNAILGAEGRL